MDNLICKKIVLSLLDSESKSANEIADEIDESLPTIEEKLTTLVSENICEKIHRNEVDQYAVKKDIETFAQLVNAFLSNKEKHREQIKQFITSDYYFTRIDVELVDYVLKRFYLDSFYQTDEDIESTRRILLTSPSALHFALHGDTAQFRESSEHRNQLNPSEETREQIIGIVRSGFMTPLLEMLIDDVKDSTYGSLYDKLQIRTIKTNVQVSLATPDEKYFEAIGERITSFYRVDEDLKKHLRPGQWLTFVDPMDFSNYGLALLHLGEFQAALRDFDKALDKVEDPIEKAKVYNNKGLAFLRFKQYQKAIECFNAGIELDSDERISVLRENTQIAKERLAEATDRENLTQPTQNRFVQNKSVPFQETRFYEFKEIKGNKPSNRITKDSDEYAVAFLNREGGRIFWGVRDSDRITVGVKLDEEQRDEVRRIVSENVGSITPPISVKGWHLQFHNVYDLQGKTIEDLWIIELVVSPPQEIEVFYTSKLELHVKTEGGKKKLLGPQITEFIRDRLQNDAETE